MSTVAKINTRAFLQYLLLVGVIFAIGYYRQQKLQKSSHNHVVQEYIIKKNLAQNENADWQIS